MTRPPSRMASDRAQLLELGKDVAADEDRLAERPQLAQELAQLDPGARVQAGRRLVEDQDGGVVHERVGEAEALLHAPRERRHVGVPLAGRGRRARAGRRSSGGGGPPAARGSARRSRGTPRPSCRRRRRSCPACSRRPGARRRDCRGWTPRPSRRRRPSGRAASPGSGASSSCPPRWARRGRRSRRPRSRGPGRRGPGCRCSASTRPRVETMAVTPSSLRAGGRAAGRPRPGDRSRGARAWSRMPGRRSAPARGRRRYLPFASVISRQAPASRSKSSNRGRPIASGGRIGLGGSAGASVVGRARRCRRGPRARGRGRRLHPVAGDRAALEWAAVTPMLTPRARRVGARRPATGMGR